MKTILFLSGDYERVVAHLKVGTPDCVLISDDFLSKDDIEDQKMRFKGDPNGAVIRAKKKKLADLIRDSVTQLIIIDRIKVEPADLRNYEDRALEHGNECNIVTIEVSSNKYAQTDLPQKDLVFISGKKMLDFASMLVKDNTASKIIDESDPTLVIDQFLTVMNDSSIKLLVINSTKITVPDESQFKKFSSVRQYQFQNVKIIPTIDDIEDEKQVESVHVETNAEMDEKHEEHEQVNNTKIADTQQVPSNSSILSKWWKSLTTVPVEVVKQEIAIGGKSTAPEETKYDYRSVHNRLKRGK